VSKHVIVFLVGNNSSSYYIKDEDFPYAIYDFLVEKGYGNLKEMYGKKIVELMQSVAGKVTRTNQDNGCLISKLKEDLNKKEHEKLVKELRVYALPFLSERG